MSLNLMQRIILLVGFAVIVLMGVYPLGCAHETVDDSTTALLREAFQGFSYPSPRATRAGRSSDWK